MNFFLNILMICLIAYCSGQDKLFAQASSGNVGPRGNTGEDPSNGKKNCY